MSRIEPTPVPCALCGRPVRRTYLHLNGKRYGRHCFLIVSRS